MLKYIARRLTLLVVVVIGVTLMTFTLMHLAPGDPAEMIAITRYGLENLTREDIEQIRAPWLELKGIHLTTSRVEE